MARAATVLRGALRPPDNDSAWLLDPERRKDSILADAKQFAFAQGIELVEDQNLLDEVAGQTLEEL